MFKLIHKILLLILVLYSCISFSAGIYPFEDSIINKAFLPENDILKYLILSILIIIMLLFSVVTVRNTFQVDDAKVLLSTV